MRLIHIVLSIMVIVIFIEGCQKSYLVKVIGDPMAPIFEFEEPVHFFKGGGGFISVSEYNQNTHESKEVWGAEQQVDAPAISIDKIKYGELPIGFISIEVKSDLRPELTYVVYIDSGGGTNIHGKFKILFEDNIFKLINVP